MTPGALGASVIHLPRRGYDVRSYVPMNESCRFEAHVVGIRLFHFVTRRHVYQSARGALAYETQRSIYDTPGGRAETKSRTPAPMPLLLCKGQMGRRTVIFITIPGIPLEL